MDMRNAVLKLKKSDDTYYVPNGIIGFRYVKERYTPYTSLDITALCGSLPANADFREVRLEIGGETVHRGIMDSMTATQSGGAVKLRIASRGFTSMLSQNELEPGTLTLISLNKLMTKKMTASDDSDDSDNSDKWTESGVSWEDSSETARYIYVKEHDSQWTAIVILGLTLNELYPYIGGANEVRFTPKGTVFTPQNVFETGRGGEYSKMASHYHMKDVNDKYSYNYTDGYAKARGIIRHKYVPFDKQFISLTDMGLRYKLKFSERGCQSRFMRYLGWCGEDLTDKVVFPDGTAAEVSRLEICGNAKKGIFTKVSCYYDGYDNKSV